MRSKGKWQRLFAILLGLVLVAAACGSDSEDTDSETDEATESSSEPAEEPEEEADEAPDDEDEDGEDEVAADDPVACEATIGFAGPVTGPAAFIGEIELNWFNYAVDTLADANGVTITTVEGDTQLDSAQGALVAGQFADETDMVAAVGPASSDVVDAAGAVFENLDPNFSFISPASTRAGIAATYTGMFRTVPTDDDQGPTTAQFLIDQGATKVFLVDDQTSYSTGLADSVVEALEAGGVEVIQESVTQDVTDFSALVSTIPDDASFVYLPWQVAANGQIFADQMAEQGKAIAIFGSDGMDSDDFTTAGSFVAGFAPDIAGVPEAAEVLEGFLAEYETTNTFGPPVYVAAQVIIEAIARVCESGETPDRANVQAEIANTDLTETILGSPVSFTADGDLAEGQFFIFEIQDDGSKILAS